MKRAFDFLFPALLGAVLLALWQWIVTAKQIPPYVLPSPFAIAEALTNNFSSLIISMLATLQVTAIAFLTSRPGSRPASEK